MRALIQAFGEAEGYPYVGELDVETYLDPFAERLRRAGGAGSAIVTPEDPARPLCWWADREGPHTPEAAAEAVQLGLRALTAIGAPRPSSITYGCSKARTLSEEERATFERLCGIPAQWNPAFRRGEDHYRGIFFEGPDPERRRNLAGGQWELNGRQFTGVSVPLRGAR